MFHGGGKSARRVLPWNAALTSSLVRKLIELLRVAYEGDAPTVASVRAAMHIISYRDVFATTRRITLPPDVEHSKEVRSLMRLARPS